MSHNVAIYQRRRRRGVSSGTADIQALVTALGGDSAVLGFWDTRVTASVTQSSNLVSQWDDARGAAGFGPSFTAAGTARGIWDGTAKTISGDGNTVVMSTAVSALWSLGNAIALYYIGNVIDSGTADNRAAFAVTEATFAHFLQVQSLGSAGGIRINSTTSSTAISGAAQSTTRRLVVASSNTSDLYLDIPDQAQKTAGNTPGAGNNALWLFSDRAASPTTALACTMRALIAVNRIASVPDIALVKAWSVTNHQAVAA